MERPVAPTRDLERRVNSAFSFCERVYTEHSVVDRVTVSRGKFQGLLRWKILKILNSVPCTTLPYTSRAGGSGRKFRPWENRAVRRMSLDY